MGPARAGDEEGTLEPVAAEAALLSMGERFMSMFDDYDEQQARSAQAHAGPSSKAAAKKSKRAGVQQQQGGSKDKQQQPSTSTPAQQQTHGPAAAAAASAKRSRTTSNEIDDILDLASKRAKAGAAGQGAEGAQRQSAVPVVDFSNRRLGAPGSQQASGGVDMKAARRAFMSHKAAKVHAEPPPDAGAALQAEQDLDVTLTDEDFRQLALQVEKLGGSAMENKEQRKQWKAQYLMRLGMKPEKNEKMAARRGRHIAKKRADKEAKEQEEAIASGALRIKGMGKKKQALRAANRDFGLQEAGPGFKGGVLKVKNLAAAAARSAGPSDSKGPRMRKGGSKGGGKGKGKGKGGPRKPGGKGKGKGKGRR